MNRNLNFTGLALAAALGCHAEAAPPADAATVPPGPLVQAESLTVALPLRIPATVYVENDATLHARTEGIIEWIGADLGQHVAAGQLIGQLESEAQKLALARARENRAVARREAERNRQLLTAGGVTAVEVEDAESALRQADLADRQAERELELTRILAPFDGVVSARWARRGRLAAPGDSLFKVTALAPLLAGVQVPEALAAGLARGATMAVETAAGPTRGRVVRVAPVVDAASGTREVVVSLAPRRGLVPGAAATVLVSGPPRRVVALPRDAVGSAGVATVWTGQGAVARPVRLGGELPGGRVEVLEGLAAGERVLRPEQ